MLMVAARPLIVRLGFARVDRWLRPLERWSKGALFDCQMCGQCMLQASAMVCPMCCPKQLRNGACGGVRPDGSCEVLAMRCVWVRAYEQAQCMGGPSVAALLSVQPPLDHRLPGSSAWVNLLSGASGRRPAGWDA